MLGDIYNVAVRQVNAKPKAPKAPKAPKVVNAVVVEIVDDITQFCDIESCYDIEQNVYDDATQICEIDFESY